ncbi:serine/threonine-protein kinase [Polyangium aurulentum]|uniref:serine/threonine-protein kinase n=1 Tax=Polyangium aurulentum TaxID=2567896 RepID=UPI0010AE6331|nr:serine/threonine-protein kinase [Polyangium aurulentum]UQA59140.1 protein kinase [Polyangium aurulentum]
MEPTSPAQQLVGAVLNGRFKLVRLLGEGGMGAVYEADSTRGEGKRAIKVLHAEFVAEPQVRERFVAEAMATRGLSHPNIASVLESAVAEDGSPYLVMDLLQGQSLGDRLAEGEVMTPAEAWPIVHQVLLALSAAHGQRIVHRDLKPDNVFLARDASGGQVVKVLDFGIAKVMDVAGGMGSKTRTGALIGTPGYMSPEQVKNAKSVDPRSDLWCAGTLLYQMLTGLLPFEAENEITRITAVIVNDPIPIEQVAPQHAAWSPLIRRSLAKDPAQRFQSADEMAHALLTTARSLGLAPGAASPKGTTVMQAMPLAPQAGSMAVADTDPAASPPRGAPQPQPHPQGLAPIAPQPAGGTAVSPGQHAGMASHGAPPPSVHVVQPRAQVQGVAPMLVAVIALVCLGVGFALGYLAGAP